MGGSAVSSLVSHSTQFARQRQDATPRTHGLARISRTVVLTWSLAGLWLLDAVLQFQPYMFSGAFPKEVLAPAGQGSPAWVAGPVGWSSTLLAHHLVLLNTLFALTQLAIAVGIVMPRTRKPALVVSLVWALLVWWLGEGFGMVLAGPVSPVMGLPGAVILYAVVAVLLWPTADRESVRGEAESVALSSPLRAAGAKAVWVSLWLLFAAEQLAPANRAPSALHDMVAGMADGEPGWIQSIDRLGATLLGSRGTEVSIVLAALFALVALGILAPARLRRPALILAMALAALIWIFGQDFGALATGRATDPNSGPLLILLAWCFWPRSRGRSTKKDGTMTDRLDTARMRNHRQAKDIHRLPRLATVAGAGLLALGAITSCGMGQSSAGGTSATTGSSSSSAAAPSSSTSSAMAHAPAMIHISSFKYAVPASVAPGATVSVMNMDGENHTVTADSGNAFDVKATAGTTVTFTAPTKPGRYPFHCTYHSNMHGVLVVK